MAALRAARDDIARYVKITAISPVYETPPAYVTDQPAFLNAALTGLTALEPPELLLMLKTGERTLGRTPTFRMGPRVIDMDIIFYDDLVMDTPELTIPHAGLPDRAFALRPLADIAGGWVHPVTGKTAGEMLAGLTNIGAIKRIDETLWDM